MHTDASVHMQRVIDRLLEGDKSARRELLDLACERLRRPAGRMLNESFPALRHRHDVNSIVHETWLRMMQTLETAEPATVADFFRLAAFKIRQVLLDMVTQGRKQDQREGVGLELSSDGPRDMSEQTYDPSRLALWGEFHEKVHTLPEDERTVFEMHYYLELPQAEIAKVLGLHPRKVSYLWVSATEKLAEHVERLSS